jgi:predicted DNA-binding transcriptional regulator YafY
MEGWSFLSKHGRVLLCIAHDPGVRLRDIAASVGITERSAYAMVTDLTAAGYTVKRKDGRRNRYQIQAHFPLPGPASQHLAIGEVLALLAGASAGRQLTRGNLPEASNAADTTPTEPGGIPG